MTVNLDEAISPKAAVEQLAARGIRISERTLRERARALGTFRQLGKTMFFMPEDLDQFIEALKPVPRSPQARGLKTSATEVSKWTEYDTEELLERLKTPAQKKRSSAKR